MQDPIRGSEESNRGELSSGFPRKRRAQARNSTLSDQYFRVCGTYGNTVGWGGKWLVVCNMHGIPLALPGKQVRGSGSDETNN